MKKLKDVTGSKYWTLEKQPCPTSRNQGSCLRTLCMKKKTMKSVKDEQLN